jgi:hypothetical protein
VLLFLDDHFDNHDIDKDPAKKAIKYIRASLCTVYDKYEQYCKKMRLKPAKVTCIFKKMRLKKMQCILLYPVRLHVFLRTIFPYRYSYSTIVKSTGSTI